MFHYVEYGNACPDNSKHDRQYQKALLQRLLSNKRSTKIRQSAQAHKYSGDRIGREGIAHLNGGQPASKHEHDSPEDDCDMIHAMHLIICIHRVGLQFLGRTLEWWHRRNRKAQAIRKNR